VHQLNQQNMKSTLAVFPRKARRANFFIRWGFYLFAFLIPFETWDPFGLENFTIAKMAGMLFAFFCLFRRRLCFAPPPRAFWCFVAYAVIYTGIGMIYVDGYEAELAIGLLTLGQNILLFWLCYNLMRDDKFATQGLLSFSIGCVLLSLLTLAGFGQAVDTVAKAGGRITGLKENENYFAFLMSLALLVLAGMVVGRGKVKAKWLLLLIPVSMVLLYPIIQSGSRGGMLCCGVGILVLLYRKGGWRSKGLTLLVVVLLLAGGFRGIQRSETAVTRWQNTLEKRDVSDRDLIQRNCMRMFAEKPIFGWGPMQHLRELAKRSGITTGSVFDTHSDLLWAMTSTGLAGTIPLVMAVGFCVMGAWRGRKTIQGLLPLSLIVSLLLMSQTGTMFNRKTTWIVFAYAAATATYTAMLPAKRAVRLPRKDP
jgi:O-antigen ligase